MKLSSFKLATAAALLGASLLAHAAPLPAPGDTLPVAPHVKVGKLPNGLTYYIQRNGRPEKRLELRLVVKAGSILEDEDQLGLAHFTEHMAFNGSTHFKRHELVSYLQSIGVKFGRDLNAYTSFDQTVYMLPIPTDSKEAVEKGFLVLEDWASGITFNDEDIESERGIVLEELRMGKGASDRMNQVLYPKLFNGSRYAERLPIGKADVLRTFKPEAIRRFYRDWYRPDLMAVMVVGDIDPAEAEKLVKAHFGKLKNPANARPREYAAIPERKTDEGLVITDREAPADVLYIRYPIVPQPEDPTYAGYRRDLVEKLYGAMLSQRIMELTQQADPPFIQGGSGTGKVVRGYRSFSATALLGKGGHVPAINALVQEGERARQFGFTASELDRAKKTMLRNYERMYAERDKTDSAAFVAEYIRNFLEGEPMPGMQNEYAYAQALVPGITLEEVNAAVRAAIPSDDKKLVILMGALKDRAPPTGTELLAAIDQAHRQTVTAREDKAYASSLLDKPPAPGRIVAEQENKALGTTELTLSNGVKVVLKPTDFRNDQVLMSAVRFGGQSLFGDADIFNARYASALAAQMGALNYSPADLQKVLAGKSVSAGATLSDLSDNVSGSAGSADIETLLQLIHVKLTQPRRDEMLFNSFIARQRDMARNALARPEAEFSDTVRTTLYGDHPRVARTPRPEDFDKVQLDRVQQIYRERFASAKGMTFYFVGSVDAAKLKPLLATYLATLPVGDIPVAYRDTGVRPVRGVVKKEVRRGKEPKSNVSITFTGDAAFSQAEQLRMQALVEVLNIKLTEVLREQLGLIYGGGASGGVGKLPYPNYSVALALPCGPENVDRVIAAAFAEIRKLQENGPAAADLAKVKQSWLTSHRRALRENAFWIGQLQAAQLNGFAPESILGFEERAAAVTPADVQAAAQRYFDFDNYVQVVLYPEAG
ncbi:M16 family metallopeptidase [Pseudoduganella umbonata]|uniref:Insulinase family protein n=1 Tax=Pseudoduganella umbonata TaxID=864828 RepID=A0A4P8HR78_9BURK|nr:M16 family metallopeptidase [Pseudoduganella umbonata]MBB3222466.1 zinc protease [Pseudoduganella umbonata]QCP10994.1 insulinase family protein [Pseudoduganella umbonata]